MALAPATEEMAATHQDRRPVKAELPFVVRDGPPALPIVIEYAAYVNGKRLPYYMTVETSQYAHPLAARVLELMQMFWEKEKDVAGLTAKIDDLMTAVTLKDGEIDKLQHQVSELRGRLNGSSKKTKAE